MSSSSAVENLQTMTSTICSSHSLNDKWVLYHHLPCEKDWTMSGYTTICDEIDSIEKVKSIYSSLTENIVKFSMLFFMRDAVTPLWEDENNKNGGCFSYKVINKHVMQVWRDMMYLTSGETLGLNKKYNENINGITISPKKNFCIIKIWLKSPEYQDSQMITSVNNLTKHGVIFKKHGET